MTYEIILAPTTAGATSSTFTLSQDTSSATLICNGLASAETATVQIYEPISESFVNWTPTVIGLSPSASVQMTSSSNSITIANVWGTFQVVKTMTSASVGISVNQFVSARI